MTDPRIPALLKQASLALSEARLLLELQDTGLPAKDLELLEAAHVAISQVRGRHDLTLRNMLA